jgi:integrase
MAASDTRRDILFSSYAQEWYEVYKKPLIAVSSQSGYNAALARLLPYFEDRQLRSITAAELQMYMNKLSGMSKTTIAYHNAIIRNVFESAYANGIIDRDPSRGLKKPSAEKKSRRALTDAETTAALSVGSKHPEGLLLLILYYTGLRRGEALGLQWRDVDFLKKQISVKRDVDFITGTIGALKTKSSIRTVPIPAELLSVLSRVRGVGETFVIQSPQSHSFLSIRTFNRRWDRLMKAMRDEDPSIEQENGMSILTPHYFRHNYASVLYNAGVDILAAQKFLGHSDIKTTLEIYSHLSEGKETESAEKVRAAFSAVKKS